MDGYRYEALNKIILRKYSRIPSICRRCQLEIDSRPAGQQYQIKIKSANDPAARPPCLVGPAAVCPAPPNTMRSVHGPRVRRRPAASPAVISRSAYTHGHTGKAREEPPRTEIERHRPAVEAPCRGLTAATQKVRIPCDVSLTVFVVLFLMVQLVVVQILFRSPQHVASASGGSTRHGPTPAARNIRRRVKKGHW